MRREQNRRSFPIVNVGVFARSLYNSTNTFHSGNSITNLIGFSENRYSKIATTRIPRFRYIFLQSAEAFRNSNSYFFGRVFSFLAKRFFVKTRNYDNYGTIHASVASRAFASLGIGNTSHTKNNLSADPVPAVLFSIDSNNSSENFNKNFLKNSFSNLARISCSTHQPYHAVQQLHPENNSFYALPRTSLYERSGHFRVLEGRLRKHTKVITKPRFNFSLEVILSTFCRRQDIRF